MRYFGYLADYAGGREKIIKVGEGARIRDIITLPPDIDLEEVVILRNGKPASLDDEVNADDTISVLPHISGGSSRQAYTCF